MNHSNYNSNGQRITSEWDEPVVNTTPARPKAPRASIPPKPAPVKPPPDPQIFAGKLIYFLEVDDPSNPAFAQTPGLIQRACDHGAIVRVVPTLRKTYLPTWWPLTPLTPADYEALTPKPSAPPDPRMDPVGILIVIPETHPLQTQHGKERPFKSARIRELIEQARCVEGGVSNLSDANTCIVRAQYLVKCMNERRLAPTGGTDAYEPTFWSDALMTTVSDDESDGTYESGEAAAGAGEEELEEEEEDPETRRKEIALTEALRAAAERAAAGGPSGAGPCPSSSRLLDLIRGESPEVQMEDAAAAAGGGGPSSRFSPEGTAGPSGGKLYVWRERTPGDATGFLRLKEEPYEPLAVMKSMAKLFRNHRGVKNVEELEEDRGEGAGQLLEEDDRLAALEQQASLRDLVSRAARGDEAAVAALQANAGSDQRGTCAHLCCHNAKACLITGLEDVMSCYDGIKTDSRLINYKKNAILNGIAVLINVNRPLTAADIEELIRRSHTKKRHGERKVGTKTALKIKEIFENGSTERARVLLNNEERLVRAELTGVFGIGATRAGQLYDAGYRSIDDLRQGVRQKMVRGGEMKVLREAE